MKTKSMILCAVFAAVMCVFSVITIPIGPVPITLGFFGVMLIGIVLGPKLGAISVAVYLLIGAVGLPVFSGFGAGFGVLLGPTGGYAWSYIIMAVIIGAATKKLPDKKIWAAIKIFAACLAAILVGYTAGTIQFMAVVKSNLSRALALCVVPFVPFDIAKAAAAVYVGMVVRTALVKAKIL